MAGALTNTPAVESALLRSLTAEEAARIGGLIDQVSARLRNRRPDVDDLIEAWSASPRPANAVDPDVVASVLAEILTRKLNNPKGLWSQSDSSTDGPYSDTHSETYPGQRGGDGAGAVGGIEVTDSDLRQIFRRGGARRGTIHLVARGL